MDTSSRTGRLRISSNILDRPLSRAKGEVSLSAFAFLFSEIVQYTQNKISSIEDFERKLESLGFGIGQRLLELIASRERATKRETRIVNMLQYVQNVVWKHLFNKPAETLQKSMENDDEYMIHESDPITNTFVSLPADLENLNCAAFIAGIIAGILDSAKFTARVTAHSTMMGEGAAEKMGTIFLIKFSDEVMARERGLS